MLRRTYACALLLSLSSLGPACTDSEILGEHPRPDGDVSARDDADAATGEVLDDITAPPDTTTTAPPDTTVTDTVPDTTVTDTVPDSSVTDADVAPDAGCTSDDQCRGQLGVPPSDCRAARCEIATGTCVVVDTCGACKTDRDCDDRAERCQRGTCDASSGECTFAPSGTCCDTVADCDDADQCTTQQCDNGICRYNRRNDLAADCCVAEPGINTSFSPAPVLTTTSQVDDAGWHVITTPFTPSPPAALYLGNPDTQRIASSTGLSYYASAKLAAGHAAASAKAEVKFQVFLDIRPAPADAMRVSLQGAGQTVFVWDRNSTAKFGEWQAVKVNVTLPVDADWSLVLEYNSNTPPDGFETGIYLDDIQVRLGCGASQGCEPGSRCQSDDPCQFGVCNTDGACQFTPIPGCGCAEGCDDNNGCTVDSCSSAGQCTHTAIPSCCAGDNCCTGDQDCHDGDPCTSGACTNGVCVQTRLPTPGCSAACTNASGCNDNNPCTTDACTTQGRCQNTPTDCDDGFDCTLDFCDGNLGCQHVPSPECVCTPATLWARTFEQGEPGDVNIDGTQAGIQWRVDNRKSHSPTRALRYGDGQGEDYSNGFRTWGRATGPSIAIPQGAGGVRLTFWTLVDVDDDLDHDFFVARVLVGQDNIPVWSRAELEGGNTAGQWRQIVVDLPPSVIGKTIQIRWVFDSIDGDDNNSSGVYLDDVQLSVTCPPTL